MLRRRREPRDSDDHVGNDSDDDWDDGDHLAFTVVANFGRCPSSVPVSSLTALDSRAVKELATTLVPITALNVRVC